MAQNIISVYFSNTKKILLNFNKQFSKSSINEIIKGSITTFFLRILSTALGFFINILIARILGVTETGLYYLSFAIITVLASISRLGMDQVLTRFISQSLIEKNYLKINSIYKHVMLSSAGIGLIFSLIFWGSASFITNTFLNKPQLTPILKVALIGVIPFSIYWLHSHCYQGLKKMIPFQFFQNLGPNLFMFAFLGGIFIWKYLLGGHFIIDDAYSLSFLYVIISFVIAIIGIFSWFTQPWASFKSEQFSKKILWGMAIPLLGVLCLNLIVSWAGQLFLGVWSSIDDVAIYGVAFKIANLISLILMATNSIAFPKFAEILHSSNKKELIGIVITTTRLMILAAVPLLFIICFFSETLLSLFGNDFIIGKSTLIILSIGQFINVSSGSVGGLLNMSGNTHYTFLGGIISTLSFLVISFCFIPKYGAKGAAIAQSTSICIQMAIYTYGVRRTLGPVLLNN